MRWPLSQSEALGPDGCFCPAHPHQVAKLPGNNESVAGRRLWLNMHLAALHLHWPMAVLPPLPTDACVHYAQGDIMHLVQ